MLNVVDLFSGAGGFSLAAREAGLKIAFAVENNKWAIETYKHNFCNDQHADKPYLYESDIENLDAVELNNRHFSETRCDLVLGGPPCQGFSSHRLKLSGVLDIRNRLIHSYFSFVETLKPRMFLMENVTGLLWPKHDRELKKFYNVAENSGYKIFAPVVLDARNYGLPQRRKRVFILGVNPSIDLDLFNWPPQQTHGSYINRSQNKNLKKWISCKKVFHQTSQDDTCDIHMNHGVELTTAFENTPKNGGSRIDSGRLLPCHKKHSGHKDVYGRIDPDLPAPTMTTACINPSKGRFVHPTQNHGITVRQAARIQTFPDSFSFLGGLTASGQQIGNAVPVLLGKILIQHLSSFLQENDKILDNNYSIVKNRDLL